MSHGRPDPSGPTSRSRRGRTSPVPTSAARHRPAGPTEADSVPSGPDLAAPDPGSPAAHPPATQPCAGPPAGRRARILLLSRPGCHLCDDARAVIERVAADVGAGWAERDITASAEDMKEYWDKIPVTFVDGVQIDFWRVSETRLRAALARPAGDPATPA
jgi:hypothetical protein